MKLQIIREIEAALLLIERLSEYHPLESRQDEVTQAIKDISKLRARLPPSYGHISEQFSRALSALRAMSTDRPQATIALLTARERIAVATCSLSDMPSA